MITATESGRPKAFFSVGLAWALVAVLGAWMLCGAFPFSPVEGDEMAVVNGLHARAGQVPAWQADSYLYTVQPGSYGLILAVAELACTDYFTAFASLSVVGSFAFAILSGVLLARILALPLPWALVAGLLFAQELSAAAAYANTSTLAGAAVLGGLLVFEDGSHRWRVVLAGLGIGLGGWLRFDALLLAPAIAVLAVADKRGLGAVVVAAATTCAMLAVSYGASGVRYANIRDTYVGRTTELGYGALLRSVPFLLSYSAIALGLAGTLGLVVRRQWRVLLLIVLGVTPSLLVHGRVMTTTKYLYYTVPFLLLPAVAFAQWLFRARDGGASRRMIALRCALVLLVGGEWLVGFRTTPAALRRLPLVTVASLASWSARDHLESLAVGSGDAFLNDDGFRLRGGLAFAPLVWRAAKSEVLVARARLTILLREPRELALLTTSMNSFHCACDVLWTAGFRPRPLRRADPEGLGGTQTWLCAPRRCELALIVHDERAANLFARALELGTRSPAAAVLNDRGPLLARDLWPEHAPWPRPAHTPLGFMNLFERP